MKETIDKLIENNDVKGKVFLLYGNEKYIKDKYINKIKKCFGELYQGINYIKLDDSSLYSLISEINTPPFGFDSKLIIVNNSNIFKVKKKKKSDDEVEELSIEELEEVNTSQIEEDILNLLSYNIPEYVTLVFNEEETNATKKIFKTINNMGYVKECKQLKDNEIATFAIDLCSKYGVKMNKDTAIYFTTCCSKNLEDVINELRKLIEYTGKNNEIKKEYIDLITTKSVEAIVFDLTDNLGKRNISKSIQILDELLAQKEPIQMIYFLIYRHFRNLYFIKYAKENNISNINETLKLHPFVLSKCNEQARNYSLEELRKMYLDFLQIDIIFKSGNIDVYDGIINVMCSLKK